MEAGVIELPSTNWVVKVSLPQSAAIDARDIETIALSQIIGTSNPDGEPCRERARSPLHAR
jgi:hypothetical protein